MKPATIAFILAMACFVVGSIIWLSACEALPSSAPSEPGHASRVIVHPATPSVPRWTEERLVDGHSAHETLYDGDKVIPGVPAEFPVVELNGRAMR